MGCKLDRRNRSGFTVADMAVTEDSCTVGLIS